MMLHLWMNVVELEEENGVPRESGGDVESDYTLDETSLGLCSHPCVFSMRFKSCVAGNMQQCKHEKPQTRTEAKVALHADKAHGSGRHHRPNPKADQNLITP